MGQSCCAGRSLKVHLKYCLRSCKHTLRVMTMTGFWQLIQEWKMGCTLKRYALQGRIEFPSLSICLNGSESVRNVSSWSEAEWWMDGLLCAERGKAGVGAGTGRCLPGLKCWQSLTLKSHVRWGQLVRTGKKWGIWVVWRVGPAAAHFLGSRV